jgi:dephospho-CoA kinase
MGKEISRFEQGQDDFIENIEDSVIRYDGGRVAANESLKAEIKKLGLRKTTKETGLDRKTIRAVLTGEKVKVSTLAKVVNGLQSQWQRPTGGRFLGSRKESK